VLVGSGSEDGGGVGGRVEGVGVGDIGGEAGGGRFGVGVLLCVVGIGRMVCHARVVRRRVSVPRVVAIEVVVCSGTVACFGVRRICVLVTVGIWVRDEGMIWGDARRSFMLCGRKRRRSGLGCQMLRDHVEGVINGNAHCFLKAFSGSCTIINISLGSCTVKVKHT